MLGSLDDFVVMFALFVLLGINDVFGTPEWFGRLYLRFAFCQTRASNLLHRVGF